MRSPFIIAAYLFAIVAANYAVSRFGPAALPVTAFVLIPFDLFARDLLHEKWNGEALRANMGALILSGSVLSLVLNLASWQVAVASCIAFASAGIVDTVVYQMAEGETKGFKMNLSNGCSAIVDSVAFPAIAFGLFDPGLSMTQAAAKFAGGFLWTYLYLKLPKLTREGE